jgi:hypothetical protein
VNSNNKIPPPTTLYRYRPLGNAELVKRELDAIFNSYLYAPRFDQMNDPMEALFEYPREDRMAVLMPKNLLEFASKALEGAAATAKKSGLISMSTTHLDYPLWAYYASNFEGMCLEFDTQELAIADLYQHLLVPVVYNSIAPPPVTFELLGYSDPMDVVNGRLMQKRQEWQHENEWRYLAGREGRKLYTDPALKRIYLGRILYKMKNRPVEIYEGSVRGYEVEFKCIQKSTAREACERTGAGIFDRHLILSSAKELRAALGDNFDTLERKCHELSAHPNLERIDGVRATNNQTIVCVTATYRLRGGRDISRNHLFDADMNLLP